MSAAVDIIQIVVTIIALGVAAQVFADRLWIPSVVFLIFAGVIVGPEGLGPITASNGERPRRYSWDESESPRDSYVCSFRWL